MKEKKYALYGIGVILISLIGISLSYFATQIVGKEKNISVNTKDLRIIFNNGDATTGENVVAEDNWSMTKTFSVENKSNSTYKYNIVIKDLINTFKTTGYLQYKIASTDGGYNMTSFEDVPKRSTIADTVLAYSVSIEAGVTQNYTITIQYPNDANIDQSDDMGATLSGKLYISEGTPMPTLAEVILRDNPTISERTDFSVTNVANTTGTIYQTNKTEDGSTVYYYSGKTTNNWVKFGKETETECTYNGKTVWYAVYDEENDAIKFERKTITSDECISTNICAFSAELVVGLTEEQCTNENGIRGIWTTVKATVGNKSAKELFWRIIRTNEDGSIRLLYSGINYETLYPFIGSSPFNIIDWQMNDSTLNGYMYGTTGSLENNRTNENSSNVKKVIDNWYSENIVNGYDKYVSKTAIYCNDRSISSGTYSSKPYFGTYTRLNNYSPTYKCGGNASDGLFESTQALADKFSASTSGGGNGQLTYSIAMMTADEVSFAGGIRSNSNTGDVSWFGQNGLNEVFEAGSWWIMSPMNYSGAFNQIFVVTHNSITYDPQWGNAKIRPVISLNACAKIKLGNGTPESPYEIDYENSCN